MKYHPLISFFIGLMISGIVLGFLYVLFQLSTFNLAGGETLQQIKSQRIALLIGSIIVAIITVLIARYLTTTRRKFVAYGISIFPLLALLVVGVFLFDRHFSYTQFDKTIWDQEQWKPLDMATTLVEENKLMGLKSQQVKEMLGQGFEDHVEAISKSGSMVYLIKENWTLTIYFQKDRVVSTELRLPWLGV